MPVGAAPDLARTRGTKDDIVDCAIGNDAPRLAGLLSRIGEGSEEGKLLDVSCGLT